MVTVISGPYRNTLNVDGQEVGEVREKFGTELSIPSNSSAQVNGETVEDDYILESGDELVFTKEAAQKG